MVRKGKVMTRRLNFDRKGPAIGKAKALVIFVHGYGADGADLLGLADVLAQRMHATAFIAPDAPEPCAISGFGRQWFVIPWLDGSAQTLYLEGLERARQDLSAFILTQAEAEGLALANVFLFGFSQGAMLSLHVAPRLDQALGGVVSCSGRLLEPLLLEDDLKVKPPILLIHGDQDQVVPFSDMAEAGKNFNAQGFDCFGHVSKGMGHGIAPDGLQMALGFLIKNLPNGS
jgi:phospholipase/carboxylesterase